MENTINLDLPINSLESAFRRSASLPGGSGAREAFPNPLWYALRVKTGREMAISLSLRSDGIAEFLPTFRKEVRWTDRVRRIEGALFPGYLFACFDRFDASHIWNTSGVLQILGTDETSSIPAEEIANLRTVCSSHLAQAVPYEAGLSRVRVVRGPFAGVEGVISSVKSASRLSVPVQILGQSVAVEIDAADTETIPERKKP